MIRIKVKIFQNSKKNIVDSMKSLINYFDIKLFFGKKKRLLFLLLSFFFSISSFPFL